MRHWSLKRLNWTMAVAIGLWAFIIYTCVPILTQQHAPPRTNSCLSNAKQLALGSLMYAEDDDGHLPLAPTWQDGTWPYIKTNRGYRCPAIRPDENSWGFGFNL